MSGPSNRDTGSSQPVQNGPTFKVYKPPNITTTLPSEIPDSFFTPTPAELKDAQAQLSARAQALTNAPLQVRAAREASERAKRDKWPTTTIRVRFPDRTQLEKTFPSTDKIRSVYAFVRSSLREDVKPIKFILYQSPPKRDLKVSDLAVRDLTLYDLHLSPSSVLLLRFQDESLNGSDLPAPLAPAILSQAVDLPPPPNLELAPQPSSSSSSSTTTGSKGKVPKWFKVGQR